MTPDRHAPSLAARLSIGIGRAPEAPTVKYGAPVQSGPTRSTASWAH
jgi:hypothetical protein